MACFHSPQTSTSFIIFLGLQFIPSVICHGAGDADEDTQVRDLRSKGLILVKIWCLIIAFVATFLSGISPYFLRWNGAFLALGTQFAGGVFFATALLHFLSDSNETFEAKTQVEYPFAFLLAIFGYLLTMFGDTIIAWIYGRADSQPDKLDSKENGSHRHDKIIDEEMYAQPSKQKNLATATELVKKASLGDSLLLILALCFHSIFEGIAIGVSGTKHDAWRNLWTISLHKLFAAIAMGIALLRMMPNRPLCSCASYAFAFAISTPVGVAIGIIIDATAQGPVADWIYAISMGIACGVFVYVAINHLMAKGSDKESVTAPFLRFLSIVLGATVMAIVMIWD